MNHSIKFSDTFDRATIFAYSEETIWLTGLWEMECGLNGTDTGPRSTRGLCLLETSDRRYEADDFQLTDFRAEDEYVNLNWRVGDSGLLWKSHWQIEAETGILSRRDVVENTTPSPIEIRRCLARIPFAPGQYDVYTQSSNWAHENQGHWNEFFSGRFTLRCRSGRTTQIANPYLFLRKLDANHGVAFHILPRGNWVIHLDRTSTTRNEFTPFNVVELGLSDDALRFELQPGATLDLPDILIQDIPSNQPEVGSANLHHYLLEKYFRLGKIAPVVYNTWFDQFESLDVNRLRAQLKVAQQIGCEVFTVDAGWYGRSEGEWHRQVGDWREKLDGAFLGRMEVFADEVRRGGLGFGLWVEPERNSADAPIVQEHPEWFRPGIGGFLYPDLSQPAAYQYILAELSRLIDTYQLVWMKVDFNFELGYSADEFHAYYERWYQLIDELRAKYPQTFLEGCASGGMRLDINTFTHFDGHFLSDTVNPFDVLRITQGSMLRLPPGRITKWAVLRTDNDQVLTPGGGSWDSAVYADVDFICRVALTGMFGVSGDLISLSAEVHKKLQHYIAFYKHWREFLLDSTCQLLTPPRMMDDRSDWLAFQFQNAAQPQTSLLFVYRLADKDSSKLFYLRNIDDSQSYNVIQLDEAEISNQISGIDLHTFGLTIHLPQINSATILLIQEVT